MSLVEILRLELRYRAPKEMRSQLDELAVRRLPAALEQTLSELDDGRIIVLRRVEAQVRLGRPSDPEFVASWASQLAESIKQTVRQARPDPGADVAVFADAITALASYVSDALGNRRDAWWWREPGALSLVRRTLNAIPGPSWALGPPPSPHAPADSAVVWALQLSGAALPRLIQLLHQRQQGAAALSLLSPSQAQALIGQLDLAPAAPESEHYVPFLRTLSALAATAPMPVLHDPRNVLFVTALTLAYQPALSGSPGLREAVERVLVQRGMEAPLVNSHIRQLPGAAEPEPGSQPAELLPPLDVSLLPLDLGASGVHTAFAGLLFLLDPLRRLQVVDAFMEEPLLADTLGSAAVLYLLLCYLRPESFADPAALWLAGLNAPAVPDLTMNPERAAAVLRANARIGEAAGALACVLLPEDEAALREHAARLPFIIPSWLTELCALIALRLVGHLRARLDLDNTLSLSAFLQRICNKPGRLVRTRTHLELYLSLDSADVAIRKAGLDLNPGWVPALGYVVNFHYD